MGTSSSSGKSRTRSSLSSSVVSRNTIAPSPLCALCIVHNRDTVGHFSCSVMVSPPLNVYTSAQKINGLCTPNKQSLCAEEIGSLVGPTPQKAVNAMQCHARRCGAGSMLAPAEEGVCSPPCTQEQTQPPLQQRARTGQLDPALHGQLLAGNFGEDVWLRRRHVLCPGQATTVLLSSTPLEMLCAPSRFPRIPPRNRI